MGEASERSVLCLTLECRADEKDDLVCALWEEKTLGIQEEDLPSGNVRLRAFFYRNNSPEALSAQFAGYSPLATYEEGKDWTTAWQPYWTSRPVGKRLFLAPSWSNEPTPEGRLRLIMHPGLACGTGAHPATQLCLEALEDYVDPAGLTADVGTGSGVLSVGAALLGARRIVACDIDPISMDVASERFANEGVPAVLFLGSAKALRSECVDLLLFNINATTAIQYLDEVVRILSLDGVAVLSGFPDTQAETVERAVEQAQMEVIERRRNEEWAGVVCRRRPAGGGSA